MTGTQPRDLDAVATYLAARPAQEDLISLCELAAVMCEAPSASINLIDDERQHTIAAYGADHHVCAVHNALGASTIVDGKNVYLDDASQDPLFGHHPCVDGRSATIRMYAAAVLRAPNGVPVGTLCVTDMRPDRPVERRHNAVAQRRRMLETLGRQVVDVFELSIRTDVLERTNAELARSQQYLAGFAGQISHDLKTPLTATMGFAELLGELPSVAADETATRYLERLLASSRRMLTMIDELLGYARFGGTLHRQPVSLDEVMRAVLDDLGELASRGTVEWSGDGLEADPAQLRALLQNLVGNALVYTRDGVPARVSVDLREATDGMELLVTDNGSGIPVDRRQEVLLPLTRIRTDLPGTGLGLATCQRIVAGHGGRLRIGDAPGGGTEVSILFPR